MPVIIEFLLYYPAVVFAYPTELILLLYEAYFVRISLFFLCLYDFVAISPLVTTVLLQLILHHAVCILFFKEIPEVGLRIANRNNFHFSC